MAFNSIVLKKVTLELHNLIGYKPLGDYGGFIIKNYNILFN